MSNYEIVTLAVYLLGGDAKEVDTEHVAMKANALAPGRFTWRNYPDQIDLEIIRVSLSDAKKRKNGEYLTGTGSSGWLLTEAGLTFARKSADSPIIGAGAASKLGNDERRRRKVEQARFAASDACQQYLAGAGARISRHAAESAFRLNAYVVGDARQRKVQRIVNVLGGDPEVGDAVRFLARIVLEEDLR
ncbi:MAG: hypothetical protein JXP73_13120 [Deltaproteobacteria bacterium]|nr:hypothetical protein [Deltaproteobacteria bacterium]